MIRAFFNVLAALALCGTLTCPAGAAMLADPQALYDEMNAAYQRGSTQGWTFYNRQLYLASIFDAGRAYSLQRPDDPVYPNIEHLTVEIATSVNYDPLINHEAVEWYVREAATYVQKNPNDPAEQAKATDLLARVNALDDPQALAQLADADAAANLQAYPRDADALMQRVEADWRGWLITHDPSWRAWAFVRAAQYGFPIADLPATWGKPFLEALKSATTGGNGFTPAERDNAQLVLDHLNAAQKNLKIIGSVTAQASHDRVMSTLAPADEYFGPMGMSILGIRNELNRVNYMIGYGYGRQESSAALQIAVSIDDLHKVYPRDRDVPQLLYDMQNTLSKIDTAEAKAARAHLRALLTVEYQDSKQAQDLLNG